MMHYRQRTLHDIDQQCQGDCGNIGLFKNSDDEFTKSGAATIRTCYETPRLGTLRHKNHEQQPHVPRVQVFVNRICYRRSGMARRRRNSSLEKLISLLAGLPWWASLFAGFAAWLTLNFLARDLGISPATGVGDAGRVLMSSVVRMLALAGQLLIPLVCVLAALTSFLDRLHRKRLLRNTNTAVRPGKVINGLSWQQFEHLIGESFREQGYAVTETGKGADGGVDLILHKYGEKYLVQCKHWRAFKVGVPIIREFFGVMAAEGAAGGFVVSSGGFTNEAAAFAAGRNIQLIDGDRLDQWLKPSGNTLAQNIAVSTARAGRRLIPSDPPNCPACGADMIQRLAKRGTTAGTKFWGCSNFPVCRGTRNCT